MHLRIHRDLGSRQRERSHYLHSIVYRCVGIVMYNLDSQLGIFYHDLMVKHPFIIESTHTNNEGWLWGRHWKRDIRQGRRQTRGCRGSVIFLIVQINWQYYIRRGRGVPWLILIGHQKSVTKPTWREQSPQLPPWYLRTNFTGDKSIGSEMWGGTCYLLNSLITFTINDLCS